MKSALTAGSIIIALGLCAAGPAGAAKAKTLYAFRGKSDGGNPEAGLIMDGSGALYGTAGGGTNFGGTVFRINPDGTETVLYAFCSLQNCTDGDEPLSNLVADASGNLYGTTVFRLAPNGAETVLHSFAATTRDGAQPDGGLLLNADHLYGTTVLGGKRNAGTVFGLKK